MNATKTPTTYNKVIPGDQIDGETIIAKRRSRDENGNRIVTLCWADLQWGPWQPANTPVSVWR